MKSLVEKIKGQLNLAIRLKQGPIICLFEEISTPTIFAMQGKTVRGEGTSEARQPLSEAKGQSERGEL